MKSSPLPCCVLPNFVSFHAALPPVIAFAISAHSSLSSSISPGLLCRFRLIPSVSLSALPPIVVFALSAQFLSFQQHISRTSLMIFVPFNQCHWLLCPCCCLCALCPIPLFPAAYLQDFSVNFRFLPSLSLAALPLLLPLSSPPHSSLSSRRTCLSIFVDFYQCTIFKISLPNLLSFQASAYLQYFSADFMSFHPLHLCALLLAVACAPCCCPYPLCPNSSFFPQHISMSVLASCFPS